MITLLTNRAKKLSSSFFGIFLASVMLPLSADAQELNSSTVQKELKSLEATSGGQLGLFAINTANNKQIVYRAEERFPMCSTSKLMTVAAILQKSMEEPQLLHKRIRYTKEELITYSPITEKHVTDGMTIAELCDAALRFSDNTAMNFLLKELGGPAAVTAFARSIGDNTFRLDRPEPDLNTSIPGDLRDTTSPAATSKSLQRLVLGHVLAKPQRLLLQNWLKNNTTGDARMRAGVPAGWIVGDKTGTGNYGTTNDIGVWWPPQCPPVVVAIYYTQSKKDAAPNNEIIVSASKLVANAFKSKSCVK